MQYIIIEFERFLCSYHARVKCDLNGSVIREVWTAKESHRGWEHVVPFHVYETSI